jgi:hypothetical protein
MFRETERKSMPMTGKIRLLPVDRKVISVAGVHFKFVTQTGKPSTAGGSRLGISSEPSWLLRHLAGQL